MQCVTYLGSDKVYQAALKSMLNRQAFNHITSATNLGAEVDFPHTAS